MSAADARVRARPVTSRPKDVGRTAPPLQQVTPLLVLGIREALGLPASSAGGDEGPSLDSDDERILNHVWRGIASMHTDILLSGSATESPRRVSDEERARESGVPS